MSACVGVHLWVCSDGRLVTGTAMQRQGGHEQGATASASAVAG